MTVISKISMLFRLDDCGSNNTLLQHKKFGLQNQLQRIVTSKFTLHVCRLNLLSISKFSDFCGTSKLNLILYQIFIVIEPKIKVQEKYLY